MPRRPRPNRGPPHTGARRTSYDDQFAARSLVLARLQAELAGTRSARETTETALRQLLVKVKACLHDELLAEKDARESREMLLLELLDQRSSLARGGGRVGRRGECGADT